MRELHVGRLIDHVHLRARNLGATKRFYRAVLAALGRPIGGDDEHHLQCDELWIDALGNDQQSATHVHLAFQAQDRDAVQRFYEADSLQAAATMARPASGSITLDTLAPSCSTRTATTWRPCITARHSVRPSPW